MAFRGWLSKEILNPRGMWSVIGQKRKGNPSRASLMQNFRIDYNGAFAATRPGTSTIPASSTLGKVTTIHNWITPGERNLVLYQNNGDQINCLDQGTGLTTFVFSSTFVVQSATFADLNIWTYFAGHDTSNNGVYQAQIYDGTNTDVAFAPPPQMAGFSATDGGAGYCTAGQHFIGFVLQNRSGFTGVPVTTFLGSPTSITIGANRQINISVTIQARIDTGGNSTLFLIMTRADNPNFWYFIPTDAQNGSIGSQPFPASFSPTTFSFVANFSDEDMAASLDSALPNFLFLSQTLFGAGPFNPSAVVAYGTRMCYVVGTVLYVSNVNNPQQVTGDQNIVLMPNQRKLGTAFPLPGSTSLYITGDRWTSYVTDNSDVPGTWSQPILVSDALGAPFPDCVCFRTAGQYAWVVTEAGVYLFSGQYEALPVTHLVRDLWNRVNWAAAYAIQCKDDVINQKLYVAVPLDGATNLTHWFCIDYQNGLEFNEVDISLDLFEAGQFSSIGIVKELNGVSNLWFGPLAIGPLSHFDTTTTEDQGIAIDGFWECGLLFGASELQSSMLRLGGAMFWARGTGTPIVTVFGPDRTQSQIVELDTDAGQPITGLSPNPGIYYLSQFDMSQIENATIRFETNAVGAYCEISGMKPFYKPDLYNR